MKKKTLTPQKPVASYEERSVQKFKQALKAEFVLIRDKRKQLKVAMITMKDSTIASANLCREIGLHLQTACNHEQINLDFWKNNDCENQLGFSFEEAGKFIALTRKMPDKVKTIEQCAPFLQLIFNTGGMLELPERSEQQNSISAGPFQSFLYKFTIVRQNFLKVENTLPMKHWSAGMADSFLKDTQWIEEKREAAKKLKEAK